MLAIKNAKIVLENEISEGKALLLSDKIVGIVDAIPENCEVIDAEGGYVTPRIYRFAHSRIFREGRLRCNI